jgi:hypothetical protein
VVAASALAEWAERSGPRPDGGPVGGRLRFVFYGRVSTEDWQDPVMSRARQREQAEALARGHGVIVPELFDVGGVPDHRVAATSAGRRAGRPVG